MTKIPFILMSTLFLSHSLFAEDRIEQNQSQTTQNKIQTFTAIEHTNLATQSFIWQIELIPDHTKKTLSSRLLTPHTTLSVLNQRALEISQNYNYEKLMAKSQARTTAENGNLSENSLPKSYLLEVHFPQYVGWKKRPRFDKIAQYTQKYCNIKPTDSHYEKALITKNRSLTINTKVHVNANGIVNSIDILNPTPDLALNQYIYKGLVTSTFYPYNKNGKPENFIADQPIKFVCS